MRLLNQTPLSPLERVCILVEEPQNTSESEEEDESGSSSLVSESGSSSSESVEECMKVAMCKESDGTIEGGRMYRTSSRPVRVMQVTKPSTSSTRIRTTSDVVVKAKKGSDTINYVAIALCVFCVIACIVISVITYKTKSGPKKGEGQV